MATLGQAYAEIHADTRPFAKELNKQIKEHLRKLDETMGKDGVKVGVSLGKGISKGLDKETDRSLLSFRQRIVASLRDTGREGAEQFEQSFRRMATGNFILFRVIGRLAERLISFGKTIFKTTSLAFGAAKAFGSLALESIKLGVEGGKALLGFASDFNKVSTSVLAASVNLGGALASLGATAATGAIGLLAMVAAVVLLIGVLAALAAILIVAAAPFAMLLNFALLLPAALSVVLGIVLPLVIALHDLGNALELVFEKDPKKLAEGLKELSPTFRELVKALRTVAPIFKSIQAVVQDAFFAPIMTVLIPAIKTLGPVLKRNLEIASRAAGMLVANFINLLQHPAFIRFVDALFPAIAGLIETLSPVLIRVVLALAKATEAALPTVELLVNKLAGFLDTFAKWIETTIADGRFQTFLDDAIAAAGSIWDLIKALIGLFAELFVQTDEGGRKFLEKITQAINEFTAWLKSPEGKQALQDAVLLAVAFAEAFGIALKIVRLIVGVLSDAIRNAIVLLDLIGVINRTPVTRTGTSLAHTDLGGYSGGGVVPHDQIALVHKGEPILDPANSATTNRGILAEAGMLDLLSQPTVTNVYLGNEKLVEYIDFRVSQASRSNAKSMAYGPRGGR